AVASAAQTAEAGQLAEAVRLIESSRPGEGGAAVGGREGPAVPLAIQEAIIARHVLLLSYRDRHHVMTCREVEPVAFAGTAAHWGLAGWVRVAAGRGGVRQGRDPGGARPRRPPAPPLLRRRGYRYPERSRPPPRARGLT